MQDRTPWAYSLRGEVLTAAILLSLLCVACSGDLPNDAQVIDGRIDLSGWEPGRDGLYELSGAWRFCPNVLVEPTELTDERLETLCSGTGEIPDHWEQGSA